MARESFNVTLEEKGHVVEDLLLEHGFAAEEIRDLMKKGRIYVNGAPADPFAILDLGDSITVVKGERRASEELPPLLYEDDHLAAYDKASGIAVVEERSRKNSGLLGLLREASGSPQGPPFLLHRLDKGTSGVWVVAKTLESKTFYSTEFEERRVSKVYRVYVQGVLHEPEGVINAPIGEDPRVTNAMRIRSDGKEAVTRYRLVAQFRRFAVVEAMPETGRTHQIRLHMRELGHPLIHDELYGGLPHLLLSGLKPGYRPAKRRPEPSLIDRLTLHCQRMELRGMAGGPTIRIESPVPKDLQRLERNLERYG
ncbi:MAG: pseudouridine synthase [Planctomycetota bacterium]